ncbi:MAG TPA: type II secretion system F family protein [Alphaproteobacteria bacterium]|jgi:tight adherence protein C
MNFQELFPAGSSVEDLIVLMAALAVAVNVFVFYRTLLVRDPMGPRLKALAERREALRQGVIENKRRGRAERQRDKSMSVMRRVVSKMRVQGTRQSEKSAIMLSRAGWRSRDALVLFFFLRFALPFVFGAVAVTMLYIGNVGHFSPPMKLFIALFAVIAGAYAPTVFVQNQVQKRRKALQKGLPDSLDLLVICAEAGQTLDAALNRVAREMAQACTEIADELSLTALELGLLPERRMALDHLNQRTDMSSIRGVVNTLLQTEKYGTPLAQSLRILSAEFRHERLMRAEAKAARLPAILTVPLIIFILPPLFIVLIGPAILRVIDQMSRL